LLQTLPSALSFREQRAFERLARELVRLPDPGEGPLAHLLPEARWRELTDGVPDETAWLMALSQATGVYFFPSREWVPTLIRYLKLLGVTRLLEELANELRKEVYRPMPTRRVWIPKPGRADEQRPLSIPAVRDRIVQAATRIVLEADFLDCSFGFRPRRSQHDALQILIDEVRRGRRWVVDGVPLHNPDSAS